MAKRYREIVIGPVANGSRLDNLHVGHRAVLADDAQPCRGRVPVQILGPVTWIETARILEPPEVTGD